MCVLKAGDSRPERKRGTFENRNVGALNLQGAHQKNILPQGPIPIVGTGVGLPLPGPGGGA